MTDIDEQRRFFEDMDPARAILLVNTLVRNEFLPFVRRSLMTLGIEVSWNWHIEAIVSFCRDLIHDDKFQYGIVNLPPRSAKSIIVSQILPAFLLATNVRYRILCLSHSERIAQENSAATLRIMNADWYRRAFPHVKIVRGTLDLIITADGGTRYAIPCGGAVTGLGANLIIIDDPMAPSEAESDLVRETTNAWYQANVLTRTNDPESEKIVLVGHRVHEDDLFGRLADVYKWRVLSIPAIAPADATYNVHPGDTYFRRKGELLHAGREGLAKLEARRKGLGERRFNAQYLQNPCPADGAYFRREWLVHDDLLPRAKLGMRFQSWDVASKAGEGNDYSVCITASVWKDQIVIEDVYRGRLEGPELLHQVNRLAAQFKPKRLLIEDAGTGTSLIQMLTRDRPAGVPVPKGVRPVGSKKERALQAAVRMEAGSIILPKRAPWLGSFVEELMTFPAGRHDDQVDALSHLVTAAAEDPAFRGDETMNFADFYSRAGSLGRPVDPSGADYDPDEKLDWDKDPEGGGGDFFIY